MLSFLNIEEKNKLTHKNINSIENKIALKKMLVHLEKYKNMKRKLEEEIEFKEFIHSYNYTLSLLKIDKSNDVKLDYSNILNNVNILFHESKAASKFYYKKTKDFSKYKFLLKEMRELKQNLSSKMNFNNLSKEDKKIFKKEKI